MRKNPLLRHRNYTFDIEDILSEAFLIADEIILRKDITDQKKVSKLWFLFNKWWWVLYNKLNQYSAEWYTMDDIRDSDKWSYTMDIDMLEFVLTNNGIISPIESSILKYINEGRGKYEIARLMQTSYHNIKEIIDGLTEKIKDFIQQNDIDAD